MYRAEDEFLDLLREARRGRLSEVRQVLHQLARELLLLESSDWPFLITTVSARDYAESRVKLHLGTFDRLVAVARKAIAGALPPEDVAFLREVEARDSLFPEIDLAWWSG